MKYSLVCFGVFLIVFGQNMNANQSAGDSDYSYKYQLIDGRYLTAYRIVAIDFFQKKNIDESASVERDYKIQFTQLDNAPSSVAITFYKNSELSDKSLTLGGGQTTYEVDLVKMVIKRKYGNR